ncbi:cupin domain-containing protein [Shinella sp. CPCC 101442]|uniref:cupin domain-containing protein n=1 Tax=Shinella sp. CPCC 101442 TaxID=2932265 RepID=UPI002152442B|nr:cupin domain-containing protein [Shinella sp. CPCC 101442]MCR6500701.1 cupin domain-containing protein [Shinella sp. CPCC 101442]
MVFKLMFVAMVGAAMRSRSTEEKTPRPLVAASLDDLEMAPSPIEPSWILEGNPEARLSLHSRAYDEQATTAIWDCTAGTFRWYFGWDETVMILEGEVHITAEDGSQRTLKAGDIAYFPGKSWATWRIDTYVRKIAFCRKEFPAPVNLALKLRDRLRGGSPPSGGLAA